MKPVTTVKVILPLVLATLAVHVQAASITETGDDSGMSGTGSGVNSDYNAALYGTPAAAPTSGNTYVTAAGLGGSGTTNGFSYTTLIRINDATGANPGNGSTNTFLGDSLELVSGVELLDKSQPTDGASVKLIMDAGSIFDEAANNSGTTSLSGSIQVNSGVSTLGVNQTATAVLNVNSSITGTGTLDLFGFLPGAVVNTLNLNGNINAFDGTFNLSTAGTYDIATNAVATGATLDVSQTAATVDLSNNLTLGALMDGTTTIGAGIYTAAQLNSLDGNSDFTGSGTITVAPEPQTWALAVLAVAGLAFIARRRQPSV